MSRNLLKMGLLLFVSLAGCSLVREQAYNLGYKDRRVIDNLRKQPLYSISIEGLYNQKDHNVVLFDGDSLTMRYTRVLNGAEQDIAEYSVEVIEDLSGMEGVFRLYGNGPLSGQYVGIQILTNYHGAYAKLNFQTEVAGAIAGARAQKEWTWVSDPLVFRSFKSFPLNTPIVYLSDPDAGAAAIDGVTAGTKQENLRFIKLAAPQMIRHTNLVVTVSNQGTDSIADDEYFMEFSEVNPLASVNITNMMVTYLIETVRIVPPNTEVYGIQVVRLGAGASGMSPVGGPVPSVGSKGFIAVEFRSDAARSKTAARMAYEAIELNAMTAMQGKSLYRWESISTADLPTRVLDRFSGQPVVRTKPYTSDEITPGKKVNNLPITYDWENTREFHFDTTNFTVRVLEVQSKVTNAVNYRFRMVDDNSTNEGVIQLQGSVGALAGQYFHFKHYYPAAGTDQHGYDPAAPIDTFKPSTGGGDPRPMDDSRLIVKIGQGADEAGARTQVNTSSHDIAGGIIFQSKKEAYKPQRLVVDMNKRGPSWVGVQDDGTYAPDSATNWALNAVSRTVQIRISTNASPKFSTYRFFVLEDVSESRIVAILSNIPNSTTASDKHDGFLEPAMDAGFPNPDNDAPSPAAAPFHNKYIVLILGTGVDSTRAKVEFADTKEEALRKIDNRTAWNLYESTAVPTPNRVIKTLAGISPWVRLDGNGYFNATHTEKFAFDADDMTVVITWHRSLSASSLDGNVVAAAKYSIPLPLVADTSLQEGVFKMVGGAPRVIQVANPASPGSFYPTPETVTWDGRPLENSAAVAGAYKYADATGADFIYSGLLGTLAEANKARVGQGNTRDKADEARRLLVNPNWHTLSDAPLSPDVIIQLMNTSEAHGNTPFVSGNTAFTVDAGGVYTGWDYRPYNTYEYEFTTTPNLQMTVRETKDTTVTSRIFPLLIVNNLNNLNTIVRINGTGSLGNASAGRFMSIRIPAGTDTTNATVAARVYATNAAISFYSTRADAEADRNPISSGSSIGSIPAGNFTSSYNIRMKNLVSFPLNRLPNNKTYQVLLPFKSAGTEQYDKYDIFNPKFQESIFVQFKDIGTDGSERIMIKPANTLNYSTYRYEVMADDLANNTLYVKLVGEGSLYHNTFAAFRFNAAYGASPQKMNMVVGLSVFTDVQTQLAALKATEGSVGWKYRDTAVLYNKDFKTFKALAASHKSTSGIIADRIGAFIRVDKNGVFRSKDTDIFKFDFPVESGGEHVTNMRVSINIKKTDGTDTTSRYYFVPLSTTPANAAPNYGDSAPSAAAPIITRGQIMYGYLISTEGGVAGSTASYPYNNHYVILRTDIVDGTTAAPTGTVRNVIIATNALDLGLPTEAAKETGATTTYQLYNFWWYNGTNLRGAAPVPQLAFNFRDQFGTDVNSRVIDYLAANEWVVLTNIPAGSLGAGSAKLAYVFDPDYNLRIKVDSYTKQMIISNYSGGSTAPSTVGTYDIIVQEAVDDFQAVVRLSASSTAGAGMNDRAFDQRLVYLEVPGQAAPESDAIIERRTRDARIIIAPGGSDIAAVKALRNAMNNETSPSSAIGEWNAANIGYALNNPDVSGVSEKAFKNKHRFTHTFYSYSATGGLNPTNTFVPQSKWNHTNSLGFRPIIRTRTGGAATKITNMELMRINGGGNYTITNVMKMMQMDAGRTIFQLAGTSPSTNLTSPSGFNFTNLFMAVEYGNDINDRAAKVVYATNLAGVLDALNTKTTYDYFDSEMATNSGHYEEVILEAAVKDRGSEWVTVANTIHNKPTDTPPGLTGSNPSVFPLSTNILDASPYTKVDYNPQNTTNFFLDPTNKVVQEYRINGASTNIFVYGYTVIESSLIPSLSATNNVGLPLTPNVRLDNKRYQVVLRLEGFGDYKNYFLAAEIGRYDATRTDPDNKFGSGIALATEELERSKARLFFGKDVTAAKQALSIMQANGSWNLITRNRLTKPSDVLNSATGTLGLKQLTGDQTITGAANGQFYSRLATATGAQSNVLDTGNYTNYSFWTDASDRPYVIISSVQSNVEAQVRYNLEVVQNFYGDTAAPARRSNDVIFSLDNLGSPLHGRVIGIRRHSGETNVLKGRFYSMIIGAAGDLEANLLAVMGAVNTPASSAVLTNILPITLRFSNDMARTAGSANPTMPPAGMVDILTNGETGTFASLDSDQIYMSLSNARWNYDNNTKLLTLTYFSDTANYYDPVSKVNKLANSSESYRVIPVMTTVPIVNGRGAGVVLLRSDLNAAAGAGYLHDKYVSILFYGNANASYGTPAATHYDNAYLAYVTNSANLEEATNLLAAQVALGSAAGAQYSTLAPYAGLDAAPLTAFAGISDPDTPANLPSTWAIMNVGATIAYQYDPSNTTYIKMTPTDIAKRQIWVEQITTPLNADGSYQAGITRNTIKYRFEVARVMPASPPHYSNSVYQTTIKLRKGVYSTLASEAPSGIAGTIPTGSPTPIDTLLAIRTKKLTNSGAPGAASSWEDISRETAYLAITPNLASIHTSVFLAGGVPADPYGAAAYVTSISREALRYWGLFLAQDDMWYPTDAQNRVVTNSYDVDSPDPTKRLALMFDANTARNGLSFGSGNPINGVVSLNMGLYPNIANNNRLNFWQRLVRQVDADTLIFQIYGGQSLSNNAYATHSPGGISYTKAKMQAAVSNQYWIVRSGQGTELWRARITNGKTSAEALQNLGALTTPNYGTDRGTSASWETYVAILKDTDFIGNAGVDRTAPTGTFPPTTPAGTNQLYSNRVPVALEVDNYTNWNFGSDVKNPSVVITIRSNLAGVVGEQAVTYGMTHLYNPSRSATDTQAVFGLNGFGPFAGRVFSLRRNPNNTQMRIVMAPSTLTRGIDSIAADGTVVTNADFEFMFKSMMSGAANEGPQKLFTPKGYKDAAGAVVFLNPSVAITDPNSGYWNFASKSSLQIDAGIISEMDNAGKRIVSKTGVFHAANAALSPQRIYDADVATNYSVNLSTTPPTISIQPVGESAMTYDMGGATTVETLSDSVASDAGTNITATALIGAVRLGATADYLGIKIMTTNVGAAAGTRGNAGITLVRRTDTATGALQATHDAVKAVKTVADHDYIKNVVTTSMTLKDLEAAGPIISLNHYRGFDHRNNMEWTFNETAKTVLATKLTGGAIDRSVIYKTVLVKDFAKLSGDTTANDTNDLYAAILLKSTGADTFGYANKIFFVRRKAAAPAHAYLSQNDFKILIGDKTNAGLPALNGETPVFGSWTNTAKNLFAGGSVNGTNYQLPTTADPSPVNQAIPQTNFQLLSTLFGGHWSKLWESADGLNYMYRKTDTGEYLFDNDKKLAIQRIVSGGTTNAFLYSVWLTNINPTTSSPVSGSGYTARDRLASGDRGTFYMQAIGKLAAVNETPATLTLAADGTVDNAKFAGGAPNPSGMTSKFVSFKFGHNDHITRATGASLAAQSTSLAITFAPDQISTNPVTLGTRYGDLYDTLFVGESINASTAVLLRRAQEFQDPYFIPAVHANASEKLMVNAARQVQAQSVGTAVNEFWKFDGISNMSPVKTGLEYFIDYDFNSGAGGGTTTGNTPGEPYNVNVNLNITRTGAALNSKTNDVLGSIDMNDVLNMGTGNTGRIKMLIRTLEANTEGSEGVVSFYYGRNLGDFIPSGGNFDAATWDRATNQNAATGLQLSNRYLAVKVGTGSDLHTAKFVWGNTLAQAKANLAAMTYYNIAAFGLRGVLTTNTLENLNLADGSAFVGPFVREDPSANYTIYVNGNTDRDARLVTIFKTKPANVSDLRFTQYQFKDVFAERSDVYAADGGNDGTYFDTEGTSASATGSDGSRVGKLIGFGPLSGSLIRMRWTPNTGTHAGWVLNTGLKTAGSQRYLRIGRTADDLTNGWKGVKAAGNATNVAGAAF